MDFVNTLRTDKDLHRNILKFATMLSVSKALSTQDKQFMTSTLAVLVGFTAYHLVTKRFDLGIENADFKNMSNTWLKVGTMKVVSQFYQGGKFTQDFMYDTLFTLLGFNVADVLVPRLKQVLPFESMPLVEKITTDMLVVAIMSVAKAMLTGKQVTPTLVKDMMWTMAGFILYDLTEELVC